MAVLPRLMSVDRGCLLAVLVATGLPALVLNAQQGLPGERPGQLESPADLGPTGNVRRVFLEIRLAEAEPVRGLTFEAPLKNSARKVHIRYATVVTNADVLSARVIEIGGRYEVGVTLTPQGAGKMTDATARHVGRPLVVILDGELVAVQTVRRAIGSEVVISADFTPEDAARIAAGLNKW
jgi:hypothetical protein